MQKSSRSVSTPSEDIAPDAPIEKPMLGIYLVGWGISCILCGIAAAVNLKGYSNPNYCFLAPGPALSIVLIPASLILFYLLVMCLLVKCAVSSPDSNPQLSVGTQAIDLDLLDGGYAGYGGAVSASVDNGRGSFAAIRYGSMRSVTTSSSQTEDTEHSPLQQLKAFVILLVLYLIAVTSAAACVMLPFQWIYEEKAFSFLYATVCLLMGVFVLFFHCFARNDVRTAWKRLRTRDSSAKPLRMCSQVIANSLLLHPTNSTCAAEVQPVLPPTVATLPVMAGDGVPLEASTPAPLEDPQIAVANRFLKHPSTTVNFVRLHRQHYRENCNSATIADNFYNPHQSIVAKKFFKKQRRKRSTLLQVRKCRSGGSSPVSSSVGLFDKAGFNLPTKMSTVARCENESSRMYAQHNGLVYEDHDDPELISEKHPLTYDEPDITEGECEVKTGTESEATFTVPEYTEIPDRVAAAAAYKAETREQMCGTSDHDWCSCDAASDVNSEPTYNYAYVRNGYASSRSALSDNSSVNSHLYTSVAPDLVHSAMPARSTHKRARYHRLPSHPRVKAVAARDYFKYTNFTSEPDADVDAETHFVGHYGSKNRAVENEYKVVNNHCPSDSVSSEEKVETRV